MTAAIPARADVKLAYVDIQRALNECNNGKARDQTFRVQAERAQAQLQREQCEAQGSRTNSRKKAC